MDVGAKTIIMAIEAIFTVPMMNITGLSRLTAIHLSIYTTVVVNILNVPV